PPAEDHRRQGDEAPARHVAVHIGGGVAGGQVGAAHARQSSADHAGHILGGDHVDAESGGGLGLPAHGFVVQAGLGLIEVDGGKDHQGVGQIDHGGLVQQQGGKEIAGGDAQRGGQGGHQLHLD